MLNACLCVRTSLLPRTLQGPWSTQAALEDVERRLRVQLLPV